MISSTRPKSMASSGDMKLSRSSACSASTGKGRSERGYHMVLEGYLSAVQVKLLMKLGSCARALRKALTNFQGSFPVCLE